jgi:hypothetical protein
VSNTTITFLVLAATVSVFVWDRLPVAEYRCGDYWKLGLPLLVLFGAVAVLLVPVFWSF